MYSPTQSRLRVVCYLFGDHELDDVLHQAFPYRVLRYILVVLRRDHHRVHTNRHGRAVDHFVLHRDLKWHIAKRV